MQPKEERTFTLSEIGQAFFFLFQGFWEVGVSCSLFQQTMTTFFILPSTHYPLLYSLVGQRGAGQAPEKSPAHPRDNKQRKTAHFQQFLFPQMYVSDCGRKLQYLKRRVENVQTPLQEAVTYLSPESSAQASVFPSFHTICSSLNVLASASCCCQLSSLIYS